MSKIKKCLVLLMTVLMLVSLAACNPATTTQTSATSAPTTNPASSTTPEPVDETMTPYGRYPETITLTVGKQTYTDSNFRDGESSSNNVLLDLIKEVLNIEFVIAWEVPQTDYNNKLSLVIAGGDMPDIAFYDRQAYLTFKQLATGDELADMTEAYEKCAGDYMKACYDSFAGNKFEPITFDNKLYGLPTCNLGYSQNMLWIRGDWLKKLGLEPPKTIEDIKNIARAFISQDPGGNGAGNTIGMVMSHNRPLYGYSNQLGFESIAHAVGAYPGTWMKDANGKAYYGSVAPEMKQALAIIADMYKEGLIDKPFMTRTGSGETQALITDNRCGLFFWPWWAGWPLYDITKMHPEAEWVVVNAPLNSDGEYVHLGAPPVSLLVAVSKDCQYPEAIIKTCNVLYDGIRGFNQEWADIINPVVMDAGVDWESMNPLGNINFDYYDVLPKLGLKVKKFIETGVFDEDATTTDYDRTTGIDAKRFAESKDPTDQAGWIAYYVRAVASSILNAPENVEVLPAFSYSTESMPELIPALRTLEDAAIMQIIIGEKPIDYFDEFVAQWKAAGGDKLTQEVQKAIS